jgi:hypothetical protein
MATAICDRDRCRVFCSAGRVGDLGMLPPRRAALFPTVLGGTGALSRMEVCFPGMRYRAVDLE